ncbi:hypothetical protein PCANC_02062 [Puccinia coronata f. sp. avenae]|uniref:Uncharacterized protein n=1 Tax=Puccinia coronata f. sp. avenae TaxID=200324 RepID=A0A2N5W209_9BASI|nr:hypothetical protein PCANC_02062 [Puccinia coronata f. sp. avenae]
MGDRWCAVLTPQFPQDIAFRRDADDRQSDDEWGRLTTQERDRHRPEMVLNSNLSQSDSGRGCVSPSALQIKRYRSFQVLSGRLLGTYLL